MTKHVYFAFPCTRDHDMIPAGTNMKDAIKVAKEIALLYKSSTNLFRKIGDDFTYIGIAEFPYYLRDLKLDVRDITWNGNA